MRMLWGPVFAPNSPEWKNLALGASFLIGALLVYLAQSKPKWRFFASLFLALNAVLLFLVLTLFH